MSLLLLGIDRTNIHTYRSFGVIMELKFVLYKE
jgi:hypothetical protein